MYLNTPQHCVRGRAIAPVPQWIRHYTGCCCHSE